MLRRRACALAAPFIADAASKGKKALFIVHLKTLVKQAASTLVEQGLSVGIMQADNTSYNEDLDDVIVASIQTLARRKLPERFSLVVIDEFHILYKAHIALMERLNNLVYIGLSATPMREDLGKYFQTLINGPSVKDLTARGALVPVTVYHPHPDQMEEIRSSLKKGASPDGGYDYQQKDMARKMNTATVVGDIVASWVKRGEGRPTIVFAINKANSRYIAEMFSSQGISAAYIEDQTPEDERRELFQGLENGAIKVLCSVGVLAIGFDAPWVSCIILARCTASASYHMQQVGRGLRTHPGKEDCIILDHTGNMIEHGMPDDFAVDGLLSEDRGTKKASKRKKKLTACKECGYVMEAIERTCPECGLDRFGPGIELKIIDGGIPVS